MSKFSALKFPVLCLTLALTACATTAPDPSIFSTAERAIESAEAAGAQELSPTELRFAKDRLAAARRAMDEKSYDSVMFQVEQSEINALLAIEKSQSALERRKVNELQRSNSILREELEQSYGEEFKP